MKADIDDGGPAFPVGCSDQEGMRLRDWFAGQALVGLCGNITALVGGGARAEKEWAEQSYRLADAMMEVRGKRGGEKR